MKPTFLSILKNGVIAALVAAAANVIIFFIFRAAGVFTDTFYIKGDEPLTLVPIIMASIINSLIATLVLYLLVKYTKNGFRVFLIVSIILFLISLVNPFVGIEGVSIAYASALDLMHVTVLISLLFFHGRSLNKN